MAGTWFLPSWLAGRNTGASPRKTRRHKARGAAWIGLSFLEARQMLTAGPVIGGLAGAPNPVTRGDKVVFTASNVTDATSPVASVEFVADLNGNGIIDATDKLLGKGKLVKGTSDWILSISTTKAPVGIVQILAVGTDKAKVQGAVALTTITVNDRPPTLPKLTVSGKAVANGNPVTLSVPGAKDRDGTIAKVEFFLDVNGTGIPDVTHKLGEDDSAAGGFKLTVASLSGVPAGATVRFLAVATDNDGTQSTVATATTNVDAPPTIGSFVASPNPVARGQTLTLTAGTVADSDGTVKSVSFFLDLNGDGILDAHDLSLGKGKLVGGNFVFTRNVPSSSPAITLPLLAVATDNLGFESAPATTMITVT
jgi:hypothetical protein